MIVDILNLIEFETYDFEFEIDKALIGEAIDNIEYLSPIIVSGNYQLVDENTFTVDATISFDAKHLCDRCLAPIERCVEIRFLDAFTKDKTTDYYITEDNFVDIGEAAREKIILSENGKRRLCKKDCKGLCSKCGVNLNNEKCNCKVERDSEEKSNPFAILKDKFNTGGH